MALPAVTEPEPEEQSEQSVQPAPEPQPVPEPPPAPQQHEGSLPYLRGLDGLRALAVLAVMLYHADLPLYGGFLGVEAFFVISGFLITALLLRDWEQHGRVRLGNFWLRRARRLLPALVVLLAAVLLAAVVLLPGKLPELRRDTLAALGYVTNWYLTLSGQSYFDALERPSLLQHLWSLAIEEQFYLLWPLLFGLAMRLLRPRGALMLTLLGVVASTWLMVALYDPGADPSRIYYGTDTRAAALLIGCALAMVWSPGRAPALARRAAPLAFDVAGLLALASLVGAALLLNEQHPLLYRGGLSFVTIATAVAIAVTVHPAARLVPWLLELAPMRWIGLRSYSLYLWHWPVFMLTRPGLDIAGTTWMLQLGRFGLTFVLAAIAYSLVEQPIRRGALGQIWRALRRPSSAAEPPEPAVESGWRQRFRRQVPAIASGLLALSAIGIGVSLALPVARRAQISLAEAAAPTPAPEPTARPTIQASVATPAIPASQDDEPRATPHPTAPSEHSISPDLAAELQRLLDSIVADGEVPGMVLSVRLPDGSTWSGASGISDRETRTPMETTTLVRIGSLSKMFTAVVVLQLVEEGVLELDAPIATWLPDLLPNGDQITVRQLLQHTTGLYDYLEDRRFVIQAYENPNRIWQPRELVEYALQFPPLFEPGEEDSWDYSSTNYVILTMLIEEVTGDRLAVALRERIFEPLELRQTFSVPPERITGVMSRGYSENTDQTRVALSFAYGTANIVTTVEDLRRFGEALFGDELLTLESSALMQTFVNGKGQYDMPELEYGLGLMRNRLPIDPGPEDAPRDQELGRVIGHIGGFGGFRGALWYGVESEILIALDVNQAATDPNDFATLVLDLILAHQGG